MPYSLSFLIGEEVIFFKFLKWVGAEGISFFEGKGVGA